MQKISHGIIQDVCAENISWDEQLSGKFIIIWKNLVAELEEIDDMIIPRKYCFTHVTDPIVDIQLHSFSDASKNNFATSIYLRYESQSGNFSTALVHGKSRVLSKNQKFTIPRAELLGVLLMTEQSEIISKALSSVYTLNEKYFWTDSAIVYAWIINKKNKCDAYTNRRLQKIRTIIINNEKLKLVPSRLNPADIATRGMSPKVLSENKLWFYGPQFLSMPASFWPSLRVGEKFEYLTVSEKNIVCDHVWGSSSGSHSPVINDITKSEFTFETKFSDNLVNLPCDQVWGASSGTRASGKSENMSDINLNCSDICRVTKYGVRPLAHVLLRNLKIVLRMEVRVC